MKTKLNLKKIIEENYTEIGKIEKISKIKHNNINSSIYLVETSFDKFTVRIFISPNPKRMEKICEILDYCYKKNVNVTKPIKNKTNKFVDNKNKLYLTKYYDGKHFSGKKQEILSLTKSMAYLHKTLKKCPISLPKKRLNHYKIIQENELKKIQQKIERKKIKDAYDKQIISNVELLKNSINFCRNKKFQKSNNYQLVHYDLHTKNIIFDKNNIAIILDFGTLMFGDIIDDVSFSSFRFAVEKKSENLERTMNLFLQQYCKESKIPIQNFKDFKISLTKIILMRLSYILRGRYFKKSDEWIVDLTKNLKFLKLISRLDYDRIVK